MTIESTAAPRGAQLDSLQLLRAVAALLVLLYHLATVAAFGWIDADGSRLMPIGAFAAVGFAGVDLFFVISGVVMVVTCYDRFGVAGEPWAFLRRRIVRIYPLYWLATAAVLALCLLRPELATRDKFDAEAVEKSLVLWPQRDFPIVAVGWTLVYEMFFYVVFAGLLLWPRRWVPWLAMAWGAATIALTISYESPSRPLTARGYLQLPPFASPLVLEFLAGVAVGWAARTRQSLPGAGAALAIGLIAFIVVGGYVGFVSPAEAQYGWLRVPIFGSAAALVVYGAVGLERSGRMTVPRWATFWGDASYSTYLTHMFVLMLVATAWPARHATSAWTATLLGVAACAAVGGACHLAIERPLQHNLARASRRRSSHRPTPATADTLASGGAEQA